MALGKAWFLEPKIIVISVLAIMLGKKDSNRYGAVNYIKMRIGWNVEP
jgi:hypothetical protein